MMLFSHFECPEDAFHTFCETYVFWTFSTPEVSASAEASGDEGSEGSYRMPKPGFAEAEVTESELWASSKTPEMSLGFGLGLFRI